VGGLLLIDLQGGGEAPGAASCQAIEVGGQALLVAHHAVVGHASSPAHAFNSDQVQHNVLWLRAQNPGGLLGGEGLDEVHGV